MIFAMTANFQQHQKQKNDFINFVKARSKTDFCSYRKYHSYLSKNPEINEKTSEPEVKNEKTSEDYHQDILAVKKAVVNTDNNYTVQV
jgi:hypothetical protein